MSILAVAGMNLAHASDAALHLWGVSAARVIATHPYSFTPHAQDRSGKQLTFSVKNKPDWAQFDSATGRLYGTPERSNAGVYRGITIVASDGQHTAELRPFHLTVVGVIDQAPVLSGTPPGSVTVGTAYQFQPQVSSANAGAIVFSAQNKPAWLSLNASTGALQGTPVSSNVGTFSGIVLSATDGAASSQLPAFSIQVKAAAATDSVTISGTPATTVVTGSAYSFKPVATSAAGAALTFSIQGMPAWAAFNTTTGALTGTPTQVGTYSNIVINATDGTAKAALPSFGIQVQTPTVSSPPPVSNGTCGMQLGGKVTFCETFDAPAGIGNRSGDLNGNVWGVSRMIGGGTNFGQQEYNQWNSTLIQKCDGTTPRVMAPNDIIICNGQLREATNDNNSGVFDAGDVTSLAMYPKQPFDFAGRTGTVSFDVSNDTAGSHSAWPEFWMSDLPVPDPFNHFDSWQSLPPNGFGIRFHAESPIGQWGVCPNGNNLDKIRFTAASAVVVRNSVMDDTDGYGTRTSMNITPLDCVIESSGPGQMNHIELRISQGQIDVYATDAGVAASPTTLKHIAVITNANLSFSRGLIWLEDVHYNADKGDPSRPSQREHTFSWDNVAFDGPFTYRDFSYDAPDNTAPGLNGSVNLGKMSAPNQTSSWSIPGLPANPSATAARVLFNFNGSANPNPTKLTVIVNGNTHVVPWPYPDQLETPRTLAVTVPITDVVAGTNTVQLGADTMEMFANVNLVLVEVAGGVPVMPGANDAYPAN